ncbi:MAG: RNA polymerase sigma factor [Magnetococcales bacterium]|nr:RNA polymerase sigma factor [Magnetococcales bacterium]
MRAEGEKTVRDRASDALLMTRVSSRDSTACRELVALHLDGVVGLAMRMLNGNRAEAEDVAQESFLKLWRQAGRWRPEARIRTWLYRVAHNLCIDRIRKQSRESGETAPDQEDHAPGPQSHLESRQLAAAVNRAVAALPERQRTAITLVHHQGFRQAEAAQVMGVGVRALESLLARGRKTLRVRLAAVRRDVNRG